MSNPWKEASHEAVFAEAERRIRDIQKHPENTYLDFGDLPLLELPPSLGELRGLKCLSLGTCRRLQNDAGFTHWSEEYGRPGFRGTHLSPISSLLALEILNLHGCDQITDLSPLSRLVKLEELDLSECRQVRDVSPLAALVKLKTLELSGCYLIDDFTSLSRLVALETLNLSGCDLIADLNPISTMVSLRKLELADCKQIVDLTPLSPLTLLDALNLSGSRVSDLAPLWLLASLNELNLDNCKELVFFESVRPLVDRLVILTINGTWFSDLDNSFRSCGDRNIAREIQSHIAACEAAQVSDASSKPFRSKRTLKWCAAAMTGQRVRSINTDSWMLNVEQGVFAVFDPILSDVAGQWIVKFLIDFIEGYVRETPPDRQSVESLNAWLTRVMQLANAAVFAACEEDRTLRGAGASLALAVQCDDRVQIAYIGNARVYLFRDEQPIERTIDHTVEELSRHRKLTNTERDEYSVESGWGGDTLVRVLGHDDPINFDLVTFEPKPNDWLLLCTNGLTSALRAEGIGESLKWSPDPQRGLEKIQENSATAYRNFAAIAVYYEIPSLNLQPVISSGRNFGESEVVYAEILRFVHQQAVVLHEKIKQLLVATESQPLFPASNPKDQTERLQRSRLFEKWYAIELGSIEATLLAMRGAFAGIRQPRFNLLFDDDLSFIRAEHSVNAFIAKVPEIFEERTLHCPAQWRGIEEWCDSICGELSWIVRQHDKWNLRNLERD